MKKKILLCTLTIILILTSFAACGAASTNNDGSVGIIGDAAGDYFPSEKYGYSEEIYYTDYEKPDIEDTGTNNGDYAEKIIKNVAISAQTKEYEKSLDGILAALSQYGGYEESVKSSGKSYYSSDYYTRTAYMTLRIPAENLEAFLSNIGNLINVTSQSSSKSNVTSQYYDLQARLKVLEAEREAYEGMLKLSDDVYEVLEIKDRLYDVIEEIEAKQTQLNVYDNKVSFSTVTVTLDEVREYVDTPTAKTTFGERISKSFKNSWKNFAEGFQDFVVGFVGAIPTLIVIAVIICVIVAIFVAIIKRSKKNSKKDDQ